MFWNDAEVPKPSTQAGVPLPATVLVNTLEKFPDEILIDLTAYRWAM